MEFNYPKNKNKKTFIGIKKQKYKKFDRSYNKNPSINSFNYFSHFIFDQADFYDYYQSLSQKNCIKLTEEERLLLESKINEIDLEKAISHGETFLKIPEHFLQTLNNLKGYKPPENEIDLFIKNKINNSTNRTDITCRKIAKSFYEETGRYIGKSSVNNIIKNKLGYRYIKTTYKSNYLRSKKANILCLCFIKLFTRLIKLNFEIIFLDESKVESINTHLKCWRKPKETIYFGNAKKDKLNIIMAIGKSKVFQMTINKENTSSIVYLNFLKELYQKLQKEKNKRYVIILDNLKLHKTKEVIAYCVEKKINLVFNVPYQSVFNAIELCFRTIKKVIYSNLYDSIDDLKDKLNNLIEEESFTKSLLYNYKETLYEYIYYSENHKYDNLNLSEEI